MTLNELTEYIAGIVSGFYFDYNGKNCGIDPFSDTEIDMWYGEKIETFGNVHDVFHSPFFDGKSLTEIFPDIDVDFG